MAEPPAAKPLWEYGVPDATTGAMSSILRPAITATHFELKPQFIQFISNDSFSGGVNDCPINHIDSFLEKCDTFKINNVSDDAIRLRLFPFSLRDRAKEWLKDEGINTFDSWDKLVKAFLAKFKRLQRKCPHHGIQEWLLIQTFYNGLTHEYRIYIDAASGGKFIEKVPIEAKALLGKMAANDNFHSGGRNNAKKGGKHDVDAMTLLTSTVQALSLKIDQLRAGPSVVASCETCGVQGHIASECQYVEMLMEQANALYNNNQQRRPYDPYSNTYNEGFQNRPPFNHQNYNQQPPPPQPQPQPKSNLEALVETFVALQAKQDKYWEEQLKQNSLLTATVQQIQAQTKLMENQISQLAQQVGQSSKVPGHFPGNTEQPPKGQVNVVTLRNGRELEDLPPKVVQKKAVAVEEEMVEAQKMIEKEKIEEKKEPIVIKPYKPPVPFPQ
ncbi:uncharacterized protein LOC125370323 [Ricinus communis]|uniref:uncharacterized protein LOC125370323 n=1 Tax=Ricinus communis TaxID=3988 RepID=UPI00201A92A1|nr:uncharacterized protein LOC125370323 [Ricinus communis]